MNYPTDITATILREKEVDSTNNHLAILCSKGNIEAFTTLLAEHQTAGKGQRGNSWESECGMNLTFSTVLYPTTMKAREQFTLSMLIALSIYDTLSHYADGFSIKWPNDIYWKDKKICGILIENELEGACIVRCIAGIGININQETFLSPAPNPVSLKQILGKELDRLDTLESILERLISYYIELEEGSKVKSFIHTCYLDAQYRRTGVHRYSDENGEFRASLERIEPDGHLVLKDEAGEFRKYAFKEVQYII
ncbi:biotin--[acetyl-CoA-carboxylase] ligase [Phocaeicola sp.]